MPTSIPTDMKKKEAFAQNQDILARERTKLSVTRTELAFMNTHMSVDRTHMSYLRTIVTLIGSSATVYKALPAIGVSVEFSTILAVFLLIFALYFIYKDATFYPRINKELNNKETKIKELIQNAKDEIYIVDTDA